MNWATLQDAIKDWFATWTGLVVVWENEPRPTILRHQGFGILAVTTIQNVGQDFVQTSEGSDPNDLLPTVVGQRIFTVSCRVVSRSHTPNLTGKHFLERARSSLKLPSVLTAFQEAEIAVVSCSPTVEIAAKWDDRMESVASFELTLATVSTLADSEDLGTIGTIELSSTIEGAEFTDVPIEIDP